MLCEGHRLADSEFSRRWSYAGKPRGPRARPIGTRGNVVSGIGNRSVIGRRHPKRSVRLKSRAKPLSQPVRKLLAYTVTGEA